MRYVAKNTRCSKRYVLWTASKSVANTVRGQYGAGVIDGVPVKAYREEPGVDPQSMTETYVAMQLNIDNWRWAGVPYFLRTGKRLTRRKTEIAIQFKQARSRCSRYAGRCPDTQCSQLAHPA